MTAAISPRPIDGTETDRADYEAIEAAYRDCKNALATELHKAETELGRILAGAPRHARRAGERLRRAMRAEYARLDSVIDDAFEKVTAGYDPETGTLDGVTDEATAALAEIFAKHRDAT